MKDWVDVKGFEEFYQTKPLYGKQMALKSKRTGRVCKNNPTYTLTKDKKEYFVTHKWLREMYESVTV